MSSHSESEEESLDETRRNLVDDEAEESNGGGNEESDEDVEPEWLFPQFCRLPFELRQQIWEQFCPELTVRSVYHFTLLRKNTPTSLGPWFIEESATLAYQTESARTMLSTHHESRELALKALPDRLELSRGAGVIRFRCERDVVLVSGHRYATTQIDEKMDIPGFCDRIQHLAIDETLWDLLRLDMWVHQIPMRMHFPALRYVYVALDHDHYPPSLLQWCVSGAIHQYSLVTAQIEEGLGEDAEYIYCWPDLEQHRAFARRSIDVKDYHQPDLHAEIYERDLKADGIELWPMVCFNFDMGVQRFRELAHGLLTDEEWEEGYGTGEWEDEEDEEDEYESDGINDGEIDEEAWSGSEDVDDTHVYSDGGDPANTFQGFSPLQDEERDALPATSPASVSSPARESDDGASDDGPVAGSRRPNKRRFVEDSDDDDDDHKEEGSDGAGEPASKRPRVGPRGAIILSDSDEPVPQGRRSRRPVVVDSDEEESEDEGEGAEEDKKGSKLEEKDEDEDEGEEDYESENDDNDDEEEEEEEEEERPKKTLSLMERLRLGRQENPLPDDNSEGEQSSKAGDSSDEQDEDEDNEQSENGFFDEVAEESGGEGEEDGSQDEDGW